MFPDSVVQFFGQNQELLWLTTLLLDLAATVTLYRFFGKTGLQVGGTVTEEVRQVERTS